MFPGRLLRTVYGCLPLEDSVESGSWTNGPEVVWLPPEYDFEEREYTQTPVFLSLTLVCWLEGFR